MNSAHQTLDDAKLVMDNFSQWRKTVCRAGGIGNLERQSITCRFDDDIAITYDSILGVVGIEINTADEHWSICRRSRDDDLLSATFQVCRGSVQSRQYKKKRRCS